MQSRWHRQSYGALHLVQLRRRVGTGVAGADGQEAVQLGRVLHEGVIALPDWRQLRDHDLGDAALEVAVATGVGEVGLRLAYRLARNRLVDAEQVVDAGLFRVLREPDLVSGV